MSRFALLVAALFWIGVPGPAGAAPEVKPGEVAPDFCLPAAQGDEICLKDFRGKNNVVLLFYVLDFTPG